MAGGILHVGQSVYVREYCGRHRWYPREARVISFDGFFVCLWYRSKVIFRRSGEILLSATYEQRQNGVSDADLARPPPWKEEVRMTDVMQDKPAFPGEIQWQTISAKLAADLRAAWSQMRQAGHGTDDLSLAVAVPLPGRLALPKDAQGSVDGPGIAIALTMVRCGNAESCLATAQALARQMAETVQKARALANQAAGNAAAGSTSIGAEAPCSCRPEAGR